MCNIAGYVGSQNAAPILIEMMKKEEGFAGGYYTGIATLHEGKIYYAKLTGSLQTLLENTNAAALPGTIGIMHSRSKSGGGDAWSHPFIGKDGNCAYVANGSAGIFQKRIPEYTAIADKLITDGFDMALEEPIHSSYPTISKGKNVHMSDAMCQLISQKLFAGIEPAVAMEQSFCEMPSEIVGLLLSLAQPNSINYTRINMPMFLSFADHGAYLASTPLAFPDEIMEYKLLPENSSGTVYADCYETKKLDKPFCSIAPITDSLKEKVYQLYKDGLNTYNMFTLEELIRPFFDSADCIQEDALLYDTLKRMKMEGILKIETQWWEGAKEGILAPKFHMSSI